MQITIKSQRKDRKGIQGDDGTWYSSFDPLPDTNKGDVVILKGYKEVTKGDRTYHNIKGFEVVSSSYTAKGQSAPASSGGGSGVGRDEVIVRQNALTNASNLIANGIFKAKTADDVLALMEKLAAGVLKKGAEAPAPTPKAEPKPEPVQEETAPDFDDEVPF